jgi:hypothetical protein
MTDKSKALDLTLVVNEGDTSHKIRFGDFTALDARAFRAEMGMPLIDAFLRADADVDILAGLVWLHERRERPNLAFSDVAVRFNYGDLFAGRLNSDEDTDGAAALDAEAKTDPS